MKPTKVSKTKSKKKQLYKAKKDISRPKLVIKEPNNTLIRNFNISLCEAYSDICDLIAIIRVLGHMKNVGTLQMVLIKLEFLEKKLSYMMNNFKHLLLI